MDEDQTPQQPSPEEGHVGPPDLILQAIVPPTDAPVEIRAAVAGVLARRDSIARPARTWEDITFAASAIALVQGTNERDQPDLQWVFALRADSPKLGEQVKSINGWRFAIGTRAFGDGTTRALWRASVHEALTTEPRRLPGLSAG